MIESMMDQIKISKYSPDKKYSPKAQDPTTVVPANKKSTPLEGGNSTKMVACGLSNIRSYQQHYMKSSSIHNSNETLIWTSITSTTTPRRVSMRLIDSKNTFLLLTIQTKDTLSLKNTSSHIRITLPIIGMLRPTITLDTHCWLH